MTRATARRFLLTLVDLEYVRREGRLFRLTPKVLNLGYSYLSGLSLPAIAEPHLQQLVAAAPRPPSRPTCRASEEAQRNRPG